MTRSKYCALWQRGGESKRAPDDRRLATLIGSMHRQWDGILGYRRMLTRLRTDHGEDLGACRARRLMKAANLAGVPKKKTKSSKRGPVDTTIPNLVPRDFSAAQPNWVWVTDLTELKTGEGKLFLCVLKDLYDGTLVGWQTTARPTAELVHRCQFRTRNEATARLNHYFMTVYNPWRQESRKLKFGN